MVASHRVLAEEDVTLSDGRRLRFHQRVPMQDARGKPQEFYRWVGPKNFSVQACLEPAKNGPILHVSLGYVGHLPSWRDVRTIKAAFFGPRVAAVMLLPAEPDSINIHPNVLHIYEVAAEAG